MELLSQRGRRREQGVVLMITLVVLILLTMAGISAIRATDTTNLVAGNFAFKQAAMQASDRAITDALNNLSNIVSDSGGNSNVANRYLALRQSSLDTLGVPTTINWANVGCTDQKGGAVTCSDESKYRIQYYLERQCDAEPDLADLVSIKTHCDYEVRATAPAEEIAIRYRVIIRVRGPRNTTGMYEVMVSGPAAS